MREFFRGWRRKLGCVTLATALLLTAGWMRSYIVHDEFFIPREHSHHYVGSIWGGLYWGRTLYDSLTSEQWFGCEPNPVEWVANEITLSPRTEQGSLQFEADDAREWRTIHYWSLVLPLTLLSAWLILAKPRKGKTVSPSPQ